MLNHELLTKKQENELGHKIRKARDLRSKITHLSIIKDIEVIRTVPKPSKNKEGTTNSLLTQNKPGRKKVSRTNGDGGNKGMRTDVDLFTELQTVATTLSIEMTSTEDASLDPSLVDVIASFTDDEIMGDLSVSGGRTELLRVLEDGVSARRALVACNLKLVTSIARSWMRRAVSSSGNAARHTAVYRVGSWDLPSLDEVVHEGVIGLTRAADKYEPDRDTRFSTYATHWITSHVRQCFYDASTGCLRVPATLHQIKSRYARIVRRQRDLDAPPPTLEEAAQEIGVNKKRLRTALLATRTLVSVDDAIGGGGGGLKGSGAGGDDDRSLLLSDTLQCPEPSPDDFVELSILRQCLENAMASELSPHERDVVRLRLGLDDGQIRTFREVVDVCGGSVSVADVRSAERRAFKKLRAPNNAHNLMAFLEDSESDSGRDLHHKYSSSGIGTTKRNSGLSRMKRGYGYY